MATFQYANKSGGLGTLEAPDEMTALKMLGGVADANPRSGIMKYNTPKKNVLANKDLGSSASTPVGAVTGNYKDAVVAGYGDRAGDRAIAQQIANIEQDLQPIDEQQVYRDKLRMFQAEIDATNQVYAQILAEQKMEGRGNLGSGRAIQARSGLLGSDFGKAQTDTIMKANRDAEQLIQAQQSAKVNSILGLARQSAVDEIAQKRDAQRQGLQTYMQYLGEASNRKTAKIAGLANQLISQGIDPSEIDPAKLKTILRDYGLSEEEFTLGYSETKKALEEAKLLADEKKRAESAFTLSEGQRRYEVDPATGEMVLVASAPSRYTGTGDTISTVGSNPAILNDKSLSWEERAKGMSGLAKSVLSGHVSMDDLTPTDRAKVATEHEIAGVPSTRQFGLQQNLKVARDLRYNPNRYAIVGMVDQYLGNINPMAQLAKNEYDQLKGLITLEGRQKLKGQGTITDKEMAVLEQAEAKLGRNLTEADFDEVLDEIIGVMEGKYSFATLGTDPKNLYENDSETADLRARVEALDLDYDAMLADDLTPEEIEKAITGSQ